MEVASALVGDGKSHFLLAPWSRWQHPLRPVVKNGGQVLEGHRESRASRFPAMHDRPEPSAHSSNWGRGLSSVAHRPSDPSSFQSSQTYLSASAADTLNTGRGGAILPASACPLTREGPELPKRLLRLS